jgi:hypothetical protein
MEDDKFLLIAGSKKSPLVAELSNYQDRKQLDIRKYYTVKTTGELKPTQKGVSLNRIQYEALADVFSEKSDQIESWFEENTSELSLNARSLKASQDINDDVSVEISQWKGVGMSRYDHLGGKTTLQLNQSHPWISKLVEMTSVSEDKKIFDHVVILLQAYHKAQGLLDSRNEGALEVAEMIEANWDLNSKKLLKAETGNA